MQLKWGAHLVRAWRTRYQQGAFGSKAGARLPLTARSNTRIYIAGGVYRSGKSVLARRASAALRVPVFSLDYLTRAFIAAMPQLGFSSDKSDDDKAVLMWPFVKEMIETMLWEEQVYILEGGTVLPTHLHELLVDHPGKVRVCCLGYAKIDPYLMLERIRQSAKRRLPNDSMKDMPDEEVAGLIRAGIERSRAFASECARLKLPYFDVSDDFAAAQQNAFDYLTNVRADSGHVEA